MINSTSITGLLVGIDANEKVALKKNHASKFNPLAKMKEFGSSMSELGTHVSTGVKMMGNKATDDETGITLNRFRS